jgi:hypothetical protein
VLGFMVGLSLVFGSRLAPTTPQPFDTRAPAYCAAEGVPLAIDHVIFAVEDIGRAVDTFRRRGFTIKSGRLHPDGLLNAHVKLPSAQEVELMSLAGEPTGEIALAYARILADGGGGAYLALAASDLDAVAVAARGVGLETSRPSSGSASFVSFPSDSAAMAVFFGQRSTVIDPDSLLTHASGARAIAEVWVEGSPSLEQLLERLGAAFCGSAERNGRVGRRFGVANGEIVVVAREPGRRPRMLGGRFAGVEGELAWFGEIASPPFLPAAFLE